MPPIFLVDFVANMPVVIGMLVVPDAKTDFANGSMIRFSDDIPPIERQGTICSIGTSEQYKHLRPVVLYAAGSDEKVTHGEEDGFAGEEHPLAGKAAMERAAARGSLVRDETVGSEAFSPIGGDVAVAGTADRVLGDVQFGAKAAGDAVGRRAGRGGVEQEAVEAAKLFHVGREGADDGFVAEDAEKIAAQVNLVRRGAERVRDPGREGDGAQTVRREGHFEKISVGGDGKLAAERAESDERLPGENMVQQDIRTGKRGVAAEVDLTAGREPAEARRRIAFFCKRWYDRGKKSKGARGK